MHIPNITMVLSILVLIMVASSIMAKTPVAVESPDPAGKLEVKGVEEKPDAAQEIKTAGALEVKSVEDGPDPAEDITTAGKQEVKSVKEVVKVGSPELAKAPIKANASCPFHDYICNPSGDDLIETVNNTVIVTAQDCANSCTVHTLCRFFTFFNFRHKPACHILNNCAEKLPVCSSPANCVSGPRSCDQGGAGEVCAKLVLAPGHLARWTCDVANPYKADIPAGTICHANCPSWKNAAGSSISAKSTCQADGSWSTSEPLPPGPLAFPPVLSTPSMEDMPCNCQSLNLTYNPNSEPGAQFFCSPLLDWNSLPVRISATSQCSLLCDLMLVASIECKEGRWTGQPEAGWWCSEERGMVRGWREEEEVLHVESIQDQEVVEEEATKHAI